MKNHALYESLQNRGLSATRLARLLGTTHSQVSLTLNNTPGRGYRTRRKLAALLTPHELSLLQWDRAGELLSSVPQGTTSPLNISPKPSAGEAAAQNKNQ